MFTLSTESTVDLTKEHLDKRGIPAICYTYTFDGEDFDDDMRQTNGLAIFYNKLISGQHPTTSQINVEKYKEYFRPLLQKGDLLHIAFSSALSNSVFNAQKAGAELQSEFPDRKIYVVDSTCACVGQGLLVDTLQTKGTRGRISTNFISGRSKTKPNCNIFFTPLRSPTSNVADACPR